MYEHTCSELDTRSKVLELTDGREICVMCGSNIGDE